MARIPLDHPRTPFLMLMTWYSRRHYGAVLDPGLALAHNRRVLRSMIKSESQVARWNVLDPTIKALVVLATAAEIGCGWCLDFGYWQSVNDGIRAEKLQAIGAWQTSPVYTETERAAIGYAVAMSQTPPAVTDEMVEELRTRLSDSALVELTSMVAVENQRSRVNAALGLRSQGFTDSCDLRSSRPPEASEQSAVTQWAAS